MSKKILFVLIALALLVAPLSVVRAEQFDNLVTLPIDSEQQKYVDETAVSQVEQLENSVEDQGSVLGVNDVMVDDEEVVYNKGPHFFYGENITVDDDLIGDVYVAGGQVEVNGMIDGDLMVAGGTVTLNGPVTQDVRAAAGELQINNTIGGNLTVGAGMVNFATNASVGNSLLIGAGEVSIDGEVMGNVFLGGGTAKLAGKYGADVHAQADTFEVMPGVVVAGSLIADAQTSANVSDGAQIGGEKNVTITPHEERQKAANPEKMKEVGGVLVKATFVGFMVKLMMGLVSGGLLLHFLPKLATSLSGKVLESPLASTGWGFAYLVLTPLVVILMMASVVALPLSMVVILLYILSLAVAKWVAAYALGQKLHEALKIKNVKSKLIIFALGLLVLDLVGMIPVIGWVIKVLAYLMGLGALFIMVKVNILSKKK